MSKSKFKLINHFKKDHYSEWQIFFGGGLIFITILSIFIFGYYSSNCDRSYVGGKINKVKNKNLNFVHPVKYDINEDTCIKLKTDECYLKLAKSTGNAEWCEYLKEDIITNDNKISKLSCRYELAVMNNDISLCGEPALANLDDGFREYRKNNNNCFITIAKNTNNGEICESLNYDTYKDFCYNQVAKDNQDESLCKSIMDQASRNKCYYDLGTTKMDIDICNMISLKDVAFHHSVYLKECYKDIFKYEINESICEKIKQEYYEPEEDDCTGYRQELNRGYVCENIYDAELEEIKCQNRIAANQKDFDSCRDIVNDERLKFKCFFDVAVETRDIAMCQKIFEEETDTKYNFYYQNDCYRDIAKISLDSGLCEKIDDMRAKDNCYFYIADNTENKRLCAKIKDIFQKQKCYERF